MIMPKHNFRETLPPKSSNSKPIKVLLVYRNPNKESITLPLHNMSKFHVWGWAMEQYIANRDVLKEIRILD